MASVHAPVPHFNDKILVSVERTLKRFKPEEPFERSSWEIVDDTKSYQRQWGAPPPPPPDLVNGLLLTPSSHTDNIAGLAEGEKVSETLDAKDLFLRCVRFGMSAYSSP